MGPSGVAAGQHEAVGAGRERAIRSRRTVRRPGKLSNVRSSRNSSSRNVTGRRSAARRARERERRVEGLPRAGSPLPAAWGRCTGTATTPAAPAGTARASSRCARRRCTAPRCGRSRSRSRSSSGGAAGAAAAEHDRDPRRSPAEPPAPRAHAARVRAAPESSSYRPSGCHRHVDAALPRGGDRFRIARVRVADDADARDRT